MNDTSPRPVPLIELDGVSKRYGSGELAVDAIKEVSLSIGRGELVVVLGPSGSGKTTLLNLIGGIETPTSGRVVVDGTDLGDPDGGDLTGYRRETVGFVFQFFNLVPTLTGLENVQLVAELDRPDAGDRSETALRSVGLGDRMDHFPGALSGGQQQRVAIARAMVKEPPLLLCDEPTGSLDLDMGRQVLELLRSAATDGRTVLIVTHNAAIAGMADRVIRMGSGRVVSDEPVRSPTPASEIRW
ncbi:MAG: ABC transporter ATP-binding protein [Chloroflexota bacterium]|nr:ABC transporter ATP-binding protein [Chloroflexota bacterium]